ncbi:MAG: RNA 2',3'-cyclic phosphodiesterase [Candidatus Krumholzibacteriia bacterium]
MRLFVAVNPPTHLVGDLTRRLDTPRRELLLAWTRPESWHLTLAFLGEWPVERVPALTDGLIDAAAGVGPFTLRLGPLGAFPHLRRPRVLVLHADGGHPLHELAGRVRRAVDAAWPDGPQDRKDFRPHLTLARIRSLLAAPDLARLQALDLGEFEPFGVAEACLVSSALRREGARYEVLARLPLDGRGRAGEN